MRTFSISVKIKVGGVRVPKAKEFKANNLKKAKLAKLGDIFLTVLKEEVIEYSNEITERPMEDGSVVTDHIRNNLIVININGLIFGKKAYPQEDLTKLRYYLINKNMLAYYGVQGFTKVAMEKFSNKHSSEVKYGIEFDITLKEIRFSRRTTTNINTAKLNIPDIERLKEQLEEKKQAKQEAKKSKMNSTKNKGRQSKR
jgi:hypothetical protein